MAIRTQGGVGCGTLHLHCYGFWYVLTVPQRNIKDILQSYYLATHYDSGWYKAWHTWALANFEVVGFLENQQYNKISEVPGNELAAHIVSAVTGFFRSISLRNENALQDTLRLLTLWFKYGAHDDVSHAMGAGFTDVEVDTWLEVIPQVMDTISCLVRSVHARPDHCAYPDAEQQHTPQHQ